MTTKCYFYSMEIRLNHHVFVFLTIIVISLMSLSCSNRPICVDSRLDGYWNMVLDSLVINRSAKVEFGNINFNFTCKNVELPLLQTPRVDVKGKTLLDADINEDSLKKDWSNYQKAIRESNGTWELYSSKDSIKIHAIQHPSLMESQIFNDSSLCAFYLGKSSFCGCRNFPGFFGETAPVCCVFFPVCLCYTMVTKHRLPGNLPNCTYTAHKNCPVKMKKRLKLS